MPGALGLARRQVCPETVHAHVHTNWKHISIRHGSLRTQGAMESNVGIVLILEEQKQKRNHKTHRLNVSRETRKRTHKHNC